MKRILLSIILFVFVSCSNDEAPGPKRIYAQAAQTNKSANTLSVAQPQTSDIKLNYNIENITVKISVNYKKTRRMYWDNDLKPDIYGIIEFPHGQVIAIPLKENSYSATASGENLLLEKGDTVRVIIRDKDIAGFDEIANGSFVYNGQRYFTKRIGAATLRFSLKRKKLR